MSNEILNKLWTQYGHIIIYHCRIVQEERKMTNQTARVLELLKRFNDGKKVCIDAIRNEALWEGKSEKTIRRDLDVIKLVFPESFELVRGEKGCYKAITKKAFENFLNERNLSLLVQTFNIAQRSNLFKNFDLDAADISIIESKIKEQKRIYTFLNKPMEEKPDNHDFFKKLENAILYQKTILINYIVHDVIKQYLIHPYRIVFINDNFYLAAEVEDEMFSFSLFRINKIEEIINTPKTFHRNMEIEDFIPFIQTPFSKFTPGFRKNLIEVVLHVENSKAYFFKSKKFLSSQKIEKENSDGSLLVSYQVTQELELEELVKRWVPYVAVISPKSLQKKIMSDIEGYLKKIH